MKTELRTFVLDGLKIERREDGPPLIVGHAAVFNSPSEDLGGFREIIEPGAFSDAVESDDVRALINHDPNLILGRSRAGTLRMSEDDTGLAVEIDPPDTQYARDLLVSLDRGDISQMSFGFSVKKGGQRWDRGDNGTTRYISSVNLFDVSAVTYPAYPDTDVARRSYDEFLAEQRDAEKQAAEAVAAELDLMRRKLALVET